MKQPLIPACVLCCSPNVCRIKRLGIACTTKLSTFRESLMTRVQKVRNAECRSEVYISYIVL